MAKVKKPKQIIIGTLNGVNYYESNGQLIARTPGGGFTRKAIKTKKSMEPVRQNNSDFGACSGVNKQLRQAIGPLYGGTKVGYLHSKLMAPFVALKKLDTAHEKGKQSAFRGLQQPGAGKHLMDFPFTPDAPLPTVFSFPFKYDAEARELRVPKFYPQGLTAPKAATHVAVQLAQVVFDPLEEDVYVQYEPLHIVDLEKEAAPVLKATEDLVFPISAWDGPEGIWCLFVGVRYVQETQEGYLALQGTPALGVGCVAVAP